MQIMNMYIFPKWSPQPTLKNTELNPVLAHYLWTKCSKCSFEVSNLNKEAYIINVNVSKTPDHTANDYSVNLYTILPKAGA